MRLFFLILWLFPSLLSAQEIYRSTGADGVPLFSDREHKGAEKIEMDSLPTTQFRLPSTSSSRESLSSREKPEETKASFQGDVSIENPVDDAVVWATGQPLVVLVVTNPPLEPNSGYTIGLRLDGKLLEQRFASGNISVEGVDRGTHTLQAVVFDPAGNAVSESAPVTFHLKRHSILHRR